MTDAIQDKVVVTSADAGERIRKCYANVGIPAVTFTGAATVATSQPENVDPTRREH